MDANRMTHIEKSKVFVLMLPWGGVEGKQGELELRYAMAIKKPIVLWILPGREDVDRPQILVDHEHQVFKGNSQLFRDWLVSYYGPADDIAITPYDGGW